MPSRPAATAKIGCLPPCGGAWDQAQGTEGRQTGVSAGFLTRAGPSRRGPSRRNVIAGHGSSHACPGRDCPSLASSFRLDGDRPGGGVCTAKGGLPMGQIARGFLRLAFCVLFAAPTAAQVPDHLKCYKVKDPQEKSVYTADLGGLQAEPGCVIRVPGKLLCVETTKTNVTPTPPGVDDTGAAGRFLCYKVKCPKATPPAVPWTDQFGTRSLTPGVAKVLCAPEIVPATTTTSSTTTTTEPTRCCQNTTVTTSCADIPASQTGRCGFGATLAPVGAVCDASGSCQTPKCCDGLPGFECLQGQFTASTCTSVGGTFHPTSQCLPSGQCSPGPPPNPCSNPGTGCGTGAPNSCACVFLCANCAPSGGFGCIDATAGGTTPCTSDAQCPAAFPYCAGSECTSFGDQQLCTFGGGPGVCIRGCPTP